MKHLIIFLNYSQSRLDNPVFRIFSSESIYRRNTALLFPTKPLDERDLSHEVSELRDKQKQQEDITFHICANIAREEEGDTVVQTIRLIRRLFPYDVEHHYPTFVYGQMPKPNEIDDETRKFVWRNLVVINNAVSDFIECRLLSTVFLYNDDTQMSLANFIFHTSINGISSDKLSAHLPIKEGELFEENPTEPIDFPPIFGGFNTLGVYYPEVETRAHLRFHYLCSTLKYALPDVNEISMEICDAEANRILSFVPIDIPRLCLQEDSFLQLSLEDTAQWMPTEKYWDKNIEEQSRELADVPREDWLIKMRHNVDALYHGRFRDIGCDYFFKLHDKKIEEYRNALSGIIANEFSRSALCQPFTPEALKNIVRIIVNNLQLKVIEIQKLKADTAAQIDQTERELTEYKDKWSSLNIFSRMLGKNSQIIDQYRDALKKLMIQKCLLPGCDFAVKLLNELIPAVSALLEKCDELQHILSDALLSSEKMVEDSNPSELFGIFSNESLQQAKAAIEADRESLMKEYQRLMRYLVGESPASNAEEFLTKVRLDIRANVDEYLDQQIENCTIPPILGMSIIDRIERLNSATGGLKAFVDDMIKKTALTIDVKAQCPIGNKHLLIAPQFAAEGIPEVEHIYSANISRIQLINVKYGLSLQDLDGFSGQRMFVEPSIF